MKIANAPTFFTKAERAATQATSTPTCNEDERSSGVSQRTMTSTAPDRAIAALMTSAPAISGTIGRDDGAEHRSKERQQRDEVVTQPVPQEQEDHAAQDGKRDDLVATHCAVLGFRSVAAARRVITPTRRPPSSSTGICSMRCSAMRSATSSAVSSSVQVKSVEDMTCDTVVAVGSRP